MKVYELMHILKDLPAGMSVRAMGQGDGSIGEITSHEREGDDSEGLLTLYYREDPEYQTDEN